MAIWLLHPHFLEFLFGYFAATAVRRGWTGGGRTILILGVVGFAAGGIAYSLHPVGVGRTTARVIAFGLPSALIVYGTVSVELARGWTMPRWLQSVGDASYPIYLIHLAVFGYVGRRLGGVSLSGPGGDLLRIAILTVAGLVAGWIVHVTVERPLLQIVSRRRAATPSGRIDTARRAA
jgi:peptidoglycan/LPS O-acetylase OafA/YrhL